MYFCVQIHPFNLGAYDTSTFVVWYLLPLALITFMYTKISLVLWKTSKGSTFGRLSTRSISCTMAHCENARSRTGNAGQKSSVYDNQMVGSAGNCCHTAPRRGQYQRDPYDRRWPSRQLRTFREAQHHYSAKNLGHNDSSMFPRPIIVISDCQKCSPPRTRLKYSPKNRPDIIESNVCKNNRRHADRDEEESESSFTKNPSASSSGGSSSHAQHALPRTRVSALSSAARRDSGMPSESALLARRKVIRLLIAVIVSFALCALPYHIRLLWQAWGHPQMSFGEFLVPPITFVIYYFSSALNPLLYAFLSINFRVAMRDVLTCGRRHIRRKRSFIVHRQSTICTGQPSCRS